MSLKTKFGLTFAILTFFTSAILFCVLFVNIRHNFRSDLREGLRHFVRVSALLIDVDAHATLREPADEGKAAFSEIKKVLRQIRDKEPGIRYVYTARQSPDGMNQIIVDAEVNPRDIVHLGEVYAPPKGSVIEKLPQINRVMVEKEFVTDKWGTYLSGYAPLYTSTGAFDGVLGIDLSADRILAREWQFIWTAILVYAGITPIVIVIGWMIGARLVAPLSLLRAGVERIAGGDLESRVDVKGSDEIAGLANAFNGMTGRLTRSLENLRQSEEHRLRLQTELECAAVIQQNLLPTDPPAAPGFEIAARCVPARQVGGDFFDWQEISRGVISLTLGDVMGKGMAAAMLMADVRATLRAVSRKGSPAVAMQLAELALREDLNGSDSFVTLFHARLDIAQRRLSYVDLGHGFAFLLRRDGRVEEFEARAVPLGVPLVEAYEEAAFIFEEGDALVLYSDGLIDALPALALDNRGVAERLAGVGSAPEMVTRLFAMVSPDVPQPDDLTVLVVYCTAG